MALLDANPYSAYYADFASPLIFVISLAHVYFWTGDKGSVRRHWDVARRILDWARTYGDKDGDGYLEYHTRSTKGTKKQGWKDSGDAIVYDDGTPVPSPIGTCELQGYWFAAQQLMAFLSGAMGEYGDAKAWWRNASDLKERFNRDWWDDEEGSIVLALDPDKRQVRAVTSNVGHCITCGIISDEHLPRVVGRMFSPDMFSGRGIRTLSSSHQAYNPLSYHFGTVWAVKQRRLPSGCAVLVSTRGPWRSRTRSSTSRSSIRDIASRSASAGIRAARRAVPARILAPTPRSCGTPAPFRF